MIRVLNDLEALSQAAAEIFVDAAEQAIAKRGRFSVALSGGSTPRRLHEILASKPFRKKIKWASVHIFWGDERCVPPDDPRSNFCMARETLLDHVPLPAENIHRMHGEEPPAEAAEAYQNELRTFFGEETPAIDLILLGMGDNAHTASLFPHTSILNENTRWVADVYVAEVEMFRISLTASFINQARDIVFLVSGANKASALQTVLAGAYNPQEYPAQLIRPQSAHPIWLVDKAASQKLS